MAQTVTDILQKHLEGLIAKDLKKFRVKLISEGTLTRRQVDDAKDETDLAGLLFETFKDEAVRTTVDIMKFIACNNTASKLEKDYENIQQTQMPSVGRNASEPASGSQLSKDVPDRQISDSEYTMNSKPRGTCLIINNVNFDGETEEIRRKRKRVGSDDDRDALKNTFEWLGFHLEILNDRTAQQMKTDLEELGKTVTGDCFVCCILSHGEKGSVTGVDNHPLSIKDILFPFKGDQCPPLAEKPKVFFIQACQGSEMQDRVVVQVDTSSKKTVEFKPYIYLDTIISSPAYADFLISMSTFEDFLSIRTAHGSWFIQSLCKQLAKSCPKGKDILSVLTEVNNDVSRKEGWLSEGDALMCGKEYAKQIPEPRFTLRKKLVFHVPK